jgi:hypothetical protein
MAKSGALILSLIWKPQGHSGEGKIKPEIEGMGTPGQPSVNSSYNVKHEIFTRDNLLSVQGNQGLFRKELRGQRE